MEFRWTVDYEIDFDVDFVFERIERNLDGERDMFLDGYSVEDVIINVIGDTLAGYDDIWYAVTEEVESQICTAVLEKYGTALEEMRQQILADED